jgi:hypothetical protein
MNNKEIKEVLAGIMAIAELLAVEFKDGVQASDIADIIIKIQGNEELKAKLISAYNDIDKVPSELKAMTVAESVDLLAFIIPQIVSLISAIKK